MWIAVYFLFLKSPARVGWSSGSWNKGRCGAALQRSRRPPRRRFESHFVRQLSHSRPVEQKAAETLERPGDKVKCIADRLSPHLCCFVQHLGGGGKPFPANSGPGSATFPPFHLHAAVSLFFPILPSPPFSPLSSSLFPSLSFLLSQCNVIQD